MNKLSGAAGLGLGIALSSGMFLSPAEAAPRPEITTVASPECGDVIDGHVYTGSLDNAYCDEAQLANINGDHPKLTFISPAEETQTTWLGATPESYEVGAGILVFEAVIIAFGYKSYMKRSESKEAKAWREKRQMKSEIKNLKDAPEDDLDLELKKLIEDNKQ